MEKIITKFAHITFNEDVPDTVIDDFVDFIKWALELFHITAVIEVGEKDVTDETPER